MEPPDGDEELGSWTPVTGFGFQSRQDGQSSGYDPSCCTDFSGFLPHGTSDGQEPLSLKYDADRILHSAWNSLPSREPELHGESDFWTRFLDPNISAMDMLTKGIKRPMSVADVSSLNSSASTEVGRRVEAHQTVEVKSFLQHIRDVSEKTWKEEREAQWEIAIRRWVAILESWNAENIPLASAIQSKDNFQDKAQIMVDVFYNKAPQTLLKRANSMAKLCGQLKEKNIQFPCTEEQFYAFLRSEVSAKAPSSRLRSFFEAIVFCRFVLGADELQTVVDSRRCVGASSSAALTCPRQADPFTVEQLRKLHQILRSGEELWDRAMSGMILFCVYGRSRWSDAQHAEEMICDSDPEGKLQFVEIHSAIHKTARAFHLRHMFLPVAAPAYGVTDDCWGAQWLEVRRMLSINDLKCFPLMPAPDSNLEPTKRPVSTLEAKKWMHYLLGPELIAVGSKLTSHSCKCTCLSYLAKRGAGYDDRLVLGYHANKLRMTLTYSRDAAARPLALLAHVLAEIREGTFEPDATRSGRLKPGAAPLDRVELTGAPSAGNSVQVCSEVQSVEGESEGDAASKSVAPVSQSAAVEGEPELEGHLTTDSSDSSGEEIAAWAPIVGHYQVDIPADKHLWLNKNSKMFHLSHDEHEKILLCGRRVSASFKRHTGPVRFDSAKCRPCFRLKDSSR